MRDAPTYGPLLHRIASDYGCTELAAFDLRGGIERAEVLYHVWGENDPDESPTESARAAFIEIIRPCVEANSDGVFQVSEDPPPQRPQYCVVTLARRSGAIVGAAAFIARCVDAGNARELLGCIQRDAQRFREGPQATR